MDSSLISIEAYSVLNRPVLCPNHELLAVVDHTQELAIFSLKIGRPILKVQFSKNIKACLSSFSILKWAPDSFINNHPQQAQDDALTTWLLLAGGSRLIAIEVKVPHRPTSSAPSILSRANILVDYQFEPQYGKIKIADFVLNHNHALVTFDMNTHASLVSLSKPQRDDIPSPKFPSLQGFAQSRQQHYFALLLRSNARDQIAVFTSRNGAFEQPLMFFPDTSDAQSLEWSPDGSPVLAVWDSPIYGAKVSLYTASGHAMPSLDLHAIKASPSKPSEDMLGIGVTCHQWNTSLDHGTMLAAGIGGPYLALCGYDVSSLSTRYAALIPCNNVINGNECVVWQQQDDMSFERIRAVFEADVEPSSEIDIIAANSEADFFAVKIDTMPKSVWLFQTTNADVQCTITFQNEIKQMLWHPTIPNILGLLTNERQPSVYFLYNFEHKPAHTMLPFTNLIPSSRWTMSWVRNAGTARCPLLLSSGNQFGVGLLSLSDDHVFFESLLGHNTDISISEADETEVIDTPSKPARYGAFTLGSEMDSMDGKWAAPVTQYMW